MLAAAAALAVAIVPGSALGANGATPPPDGADPVISDDFAEVLDAITPTTEYEAKAKEKTAPALTAEMEALARRLPEFDVGGAYVSTVHVDPVHERLVVGISGGSKQEQVQVAKRFRSATSVRVKFAKRSNSFSDTADREASSPFFGGSSLKTCTAGFTVLNASSRQRYLMTAGHCSPSGVNATFVSPGGAFVGQAGSSTFVGTGWSNGDLAFVANGSGSGYGASVYMGVDVAASDSTLQPVVASYDGGIPAGSPHTGRGITTGASSGWYRTPGTTSYRVRDIVNGRLVDKTVMNVVRMIQNPSCGSLCTKGLGNGDSGGPLYRTNSSGGVFAAGIYSGYPIDSCSYDGGPGARKGCKEGYWTALDVMRQVFPNISILKS